MADGWLPAGAGTALDALVAAYPWVKLHTGSPGAAGTSNPSTETTRKQATWNATGLDGIVETSNALTWTNIAATGTTEDSTDFTGWTASTAGTVGYSGTITANPYTAGDTYTVAIGALTVSVTLAS